MAWTCGYVTQLDYSFGYYRELNPAMLRLICLCSAIEPQLRDRPTYLELGFGQGLSINLHAAATDGRFWGTDFNPGQTVRARELAAASGADLHLLDDSFEEFAARTDLPDFDIIALHGIWSWISDANRRTILDIIRRNLRAGGVVYVSYNCLPGWAPAIPVRQLMALYGDYGGGQMTAPLGAIDGALQFSADVLKAGSRYFRENPSAAHHFERLSKQSRNYIAHEYLNADWYLVHFSDMARSLQEAKLSFVGSARLMDRIDGMHLTEDGRKLLSGIGHPVLRETVRDYMVNQRFRCDVFVKGPRSISGPRQREAWHAQQFVLTRCPEDIPKKIGGSLGEFELPKEIYDPVITVLSESSYAPKRIDDLMASPKLRGIKMNDVVEALVVLTGAGFVSPAQSITEEIIERCQALNQHICRQALMSTDLAYLASPVSGGGILVPHICQLFMLALQQGRSNVAELANFVWEVLDSVGERLMRDGKRVESEEENIEEFRSMAHRFLNRTLALLQALKVL
jgi:SAM-dependent methyltransferase